MAQKRIVVAGATGLVGSRLVPYLESSGFTVTRLVRREPKRVGDVRWDPATGAIDAGALDGSDAIVNLAGVSIAGKRWSESRKRDIRQSRLDATGLLARTISELDDKPAAFVSTSAVGYYGDGGRAELTESAPKGAGFLADVCDAWEAAADPARAAGVRVVHPRIGIVLASEGGMLPQLKRLFALGLGGRIGTGEQFMSWIDIDDLVRILGYLVSDQQLSGPVNAVAPNPLTNQVLTSTLGKSLGRPTVMPAPGFAIRAMMGQMADELVLMSQRAVPKRLLETDFEFGSPTLEESLQRQLKLSAATVPDAPAARAA